LGLLHSLNMIILFFRGYEYGIKESVPRLLDLWDRVGIKVTSHTVRYNDIVSFDSPATIDAAYLQDLKDDFDVLYTEAASRRLMISISTHDRISGIPGRAKLIEEFVKYAKKQKGVVFMRKDEIAKWASASKIPHEG
jgi:hypothetical protein